MNLPKIEGFGQFCCACLLAMYIFLLQLCLVEVANDNLAFYFLDRNSWPVLLEQEAQLSVIDVLQNMCVSIALPRTSAETINSTSVVQMTRLKRSISTVTYGRKRLRYAFARCFLF